MYIPNSRNRKREGARLGIQAGFIEHDAADGGGAAGGGIDVDDRPGEPRIAGIEAHAERTSVGFDCAGHTRDERALESVVRISGGGWIRDGPVGTFGRAKEDVCPFLRQPAAQVEKRHPRPRPEILRRDAFSL